VPVICKFLEIHVIFLSRFFYLSEVAKLICITGFILLVSLHRFVAFGRFELIKVLAIYVQSRDLIRRLMLRRPEWV